VRGAGPLSAATRRSSDLQGKLESGPPGHSRPSGASLSRIPEPSTGAPIQVAADGSLNVPANPIICYIEGDGTGPDIWAASVRILDRKSTRLNSSHVKNSY